LNAIGCVNVGQLTTRYRITYVVVQPRVYVFLRQDRITFRTQTSHQLNKGKQMKLSIKMYKQRNKEKWEMLKKTY